MVMVDCHLMSNEELVTSFELSLFNGKKKWYCEVVFCLGKKHERGISFFFHVAKKVLPHVDGECSKFLMLLCLDVLCHGQLAVWLLTACMDLGALVFAVNGLLLVQLVTMFCSSWLLTSGLFLAVHVLSVLASSQSM